jgi:hypothetical protein
MRLQLIIDSYPYVIDSSDPDLLARWIIEIFGRIREIHPSTQIELRAAPSFLLDDSGQWWPDWQADTRVINQPMTIRSPRELIEALSKQLDQAGELGQTPR